MSAKKDSVLDLQRLRAEVRGVIEDLHALEADTQQRKNALWKYIGALGYVMCPTCGSNGKVFVPVTGKHPNMRGGNVRRCEVCSGIGAVPARTGEERRRRNGVLD